MKAKALAVLIPALFLATAAVAQPAGDKAPAADSPRVPTEQDRANNREAVSDAAITTKVKSALAADVGLRTVTGINVDTDAGGVVTLKGQVASDDMKKRAEQVAKKVNGVKSVKNELQVTKG